MRMLVDEDFRKCVTFLFVEKVDEATRAPVKVPVATAFFVAVPIDEERGRPYLVTARHVIYSSRPYGPLYVRVNTDDGYREVETKQDDWLTFSDYSLPKVYKNWAYDRCRNPRLISGSVAI
jgi:hypothetical protein